jgi:type IV pilus assembly protein PilY1
MNSMKNWRAFLLGFCYVLCGAFPVWADDTEIYFGGGSAAEGTRNNIMFVIDTSQSMDEGDTDNISRMTELKTAFKQLLGELANVNVGLMRFSNPGGPVLYPVTNIDQAVPDTGVTSISINKTITTSADDGTQQNTAGTVDLSGKRLSLGTAVIAGAMPFTFVQRIATGTDDGYSQLSDDTTNLVAPELIRRNLALSESVIGVRFNAVAIPKPTVAVPVTITDANLQFTVSSNSTSSPPPVSMVISGEIAPGATFGTLDQRVSKRANAGSTKILSNTVPWNITGPTIPAVGTVLTTPNLAVLADAMIRNNDWASGSAMTFFYKGTASAETGRLNFHSANSSSASTAAPQLIIKYSVGSGAPVSGDVTTAVRFSGIDIPRNAKITSAHLEFTAADSASAAANFQIYGQKAESAPAFTTTNFDITGRTSRTAPVIWNSASTPALGAWTVSGQYSTPDLSAVVQEIVDQSNWCAGNNMALFVAGSGQRTAYSSDENTSLAPRLVVTYDPASISAGNTCIQASMARQVTASTDDAEEDSGSSTIVTNKQMQVAAGTNKARLIGLRFTNISIPPKSKIQSAYLQFSTPAEGKKDLNLTIAGQKVTDAATFEKKVGSISTRAKTSAKVTWSSIPTWAADTTVQSPDVAPILQELVNQENPDWVSGNDVAFIISGASNSDFRLVYSKDESAGKAPKLIINYLDNGSSLRTVRNVLLETVDSLQTDGSTPLQDTFYEAVQYFRGQAVDYGKRRGGTGTNGYKYARVSHPDSMVPGTFTIAPAGCQNSDADACKNERITGNAMYKSPINYACQSNHIVLLTDGEPNNDHSTSKIRALPNFPQATCIYKEDDGACVPELAKWAHETNDVSNLPGQQNLIVDTIAFYQGTNSTDFLSNTAANGGGQSLAATSSDQLLKALQKLTVGTISENASFVAAGVAVNAFNRMQNRDDLYFSVFKPQKTPAWPGNLKKYKLDFIDDTSTTETLKLPVIVDADGEPAVDADTGFFEADARSFWSATTDGPEVSKGGAGAMITDHASRKLYSDLSSAKDLSASTNLLKADNALVTKAVFGADSYVTADFTKLVQWTRGEDIKNEDANASTTTRYVMADPLHSRPVAITYKGTEESPDTTVFVASNGGALHAINDADGREIFAFIPKDLLPLQKTLYENVESVDHPYGLDGSITTWVIDPDGDGLVLNSNGTVQTGNRVILVVGMGRGGKNYYALDVTDRAHPQLLWTIHGGVDTGFEQLGQTWSQPEKAIVKIGTADPKRVLIIAGGYDPGQDESLVRVTDSIGKAVYMVDLLDGSLLWRAGSGTEYNTNLSAMRYSIPSQVTSADVSGDGLADFFFVGDMGGQLWRFDINNGAAASGLVTAGVIADLGVAGGTNEAANNRRFYHAPSLFLGKNNGTPYLGITIGSGWRGHPLNEDTNDMFFMVRQTSIYTAPSPYTTVLLNNLLDVTDNAIGEGSTAQKETAQTTLTTRQGWYLRLTNSGEKVLSTPLVINGEVSFTTYEPNTSGEVNPCVPQTGTNRLYQMFVTDARPSLDRNSDGFTAADRSQILRVPGIASSPIITTTKDGAAMITSQVPSGNPLPDLNIKRIYWYENRARN